MYLVKTLVFDSAMKLRRLYQACVFPFTFNGVTHNQCTLVKCTIIIISTITKKSKSKKVAITANLLEWLLNSMVQHANRW